MNKNFKLYIICWAILLALFNVICFVTPSEAAGLNKFGGAFWIGYIFITAAFIGQLVCAYIAFKAENLKKLFYNLPLITLSYTGLILTLIFGGAAMAVPNLPGWAGAIVCLLILGFNAVAVIKAKAAAEIADDIDDRIKTQTFFIKSLTADAEGLLSRATTPETKNACKKVYEVARYSDPMSNASLSGIESQITLKFNQFSSALTANSNDIDTLAEELIILITDRNKKCKLLK